MNGILQMVAEHDVWIGLTGTLIVVLAVVVGFGRQRRRTDESNNK